MGWSKEKAVKVIVACAEKYENELNGRKLLLLCTDKHKKVSTFELSFHGWNYLHLTGLKANDDTDSKLAPQRFYERCLAHRLSKDDFEFADDGTTDLKLDVLPYVICKNLMANSIGDFSGQAPKLVTEKLAGGQKACIGFVLNESEESYVPNTLLKGDIRDYSKSNLRIVAILRKAIMETEYTEITYLARKVEWDMLRFPPEFDKEKSLIIGAVSAHEGNG